MADTYTVVGPPGTGKTTHVSHLIGDAVKSGWNILATSLTRAAARELVGRDLPVDESRIGTLHAHAYRSLGGAQNVTIAETKADEWNEWCREHGLDLWSLSSASAVKGDAEELDIKSGDEGDRALAEFSLHRARGDAESSWSMTAQAFAADWRRWKAKTGYLDFSDLLDEAIRQDVYPEHYDALYVDEAQDMARHELRYVEHLSQHARAVVIVGDPRQAIYAWRGSDPAVFEAIWSSSKRTRVLDRSWRLPRAVHAVAARWIEQDHSAVHAEYQPRDAEGSCEISPWGATTPGYLVDEAQQYVEQGRSVMILGTCAYQVAPFIHAMRREGIPFANRYRPTRGDWNPLKLSPRTVSTGERIIAFTRPNPDVWGSDSRIWADTEVGLWAPLLEAGVFQKGGKGKIKTADDILEYLQPEHMEPCASGDWRWLASHMMASRVKPAEYPLRVFERNGKDGLLRPPRITVGTVHSVKGGEADVVYLLPDLSFSAWREWYGGDRGHIVRTMYVGMTRARERLVLCAPGGQRAVQW